MAATRTVRLPGPDFPSRPLPELNLDSPQFLRVHGSHHPAIQFRVVPGHRFSHPKAPAGLLYLGQSITTCLWEVFGDTLLDAGVIAASRWRNTSITHIRTRARLRICDLTDDKTRLRLGVDLGSLMSPDLRVTHSWGLAIQTHPSQPDGICYRSRFDSQPCLVLFERPTLAKAMRAESSESLPENAEAGRFLCDQGIALV